MKAKPEEPDLTVMDHFLSAVFIACGVMRCVVYVEISQSVVTHFSGHRVT